VERRAGPFLDARWNWTSCRARWESGCRGTPSPPLSQETMVRSVPLYGFLATMCTTSVSKRL
jgi:hypothetical protein